MTLDLPTYDVIIKRTRADVQAQLVDLDPTIFASLIRAITDSNSGRHFDNVLSIKQLEKELFPDTANRDNLERWAAYEGLTTFPSEQSQGNAVFTGVASTIIPAATEFQTSDNKTYVVDSDTTISLNTISVSSITRSGTTVTVTTSTDHNFATNLIVGIAGAVETDYNGSFVITVTSATVFTYQITATPTTPATGTITSECTCALTPLISTEFGLDQNQDSGARLILTTSITGVDTEGFVDFIGLIGGKDVESTESLLRRTKQSRSNPVANFNVAAITKQAFLIQGVTRVKVKRITPLIGQVTVLFVRDDDDSIIPSSSEVTEVKNSILEILQATSDEADVIVTAPTPVTTNYTFSAISPDTDTMQAAIQANIEAMYEDRATFEQNIVEDVYRSAIIDTIDPDTGDALASFTLTSPSGDITVGTDSIGEPGTFIF